MILTFSDYNLTIETVQINLYNKYWNCCELKWKTMKIKSLKKNMIKKNLFIDKWKLYLKNFSNFSNKYITHLSMMIIQI